ncbi:DEAD/DEAH box helicase family protein [Salegentibacter maritimus]|uniref:DEAD/DEAH box helicase family protein n=1 Tax=Salegentibacter maritimus TaxID=2794347 RepID=UPI0018E47AF3|nr:DEAD/DEAH box helicase family protein [Salegentibacter maritimus]MBI6115989.1 DEAD/DEAH box helicase family protein [Salegentibacter maritimus]
MDLSKIKELNLETGKSKFYKDDVFNLYYRTLCNSNSWDVGLGYFSLSSLKLLAYPLSKFIITNNGKVRIYCNERISENDYKILTDSAYSFENLNVFKDLIKLKRALEGKDSELFTECVSYLVHNNLLELKVLINSNNSRGISHHKNSIFKDAKDNVVVLSGSANASEQAFLFNREDTNAFCSFWNEKSATKNIKATIEEFENTFNHGDEDWKVLEIKSNELKETLNKIGFRKIDRDSFKNKMDDYIRNNYRKFSKEIQKEIITELADHNSEPQFPSFDGKSSEPRPYQVEANTEWIKNGYKGIFAMATGTGKTITSLNCAVEEFKKNNGYSIVITVPTVTLVNQWIEEAKKFNFKNIISTTKSKNWDSDLRRVLLNKKHGIGENHNYVFITTYASFNKLKCQKLIKKIADKNTILIADEAHNLGAPGSLKNLPHNISKRIGLSATPERIYDESGSSKLYEFFKSTPPNYTYKFSMREAIDQGFLTPYFYYPYFVNLEHDELENYLEITRELVKHYDFTNDKWKDSATQKLIQRKRIIHKAQNKKECLKQIFEDVKLKNETLKYTFVYVPEGYEPDNGTTDNSEIEEEDVRIINTYSEIINGFGYKTYQFLGETKNRNKILNQFKKGELEILTAMKALDEGVDIPITKNAIFCASTGNPRQFIQRRGRVLRLHKGKDYANIYDMIVTPSMNILNYEDPALREMEVRIFKNELARVANFLYSSENMMDVINDKIREVADEFNLDIFNLINENIENDKIENDKIEKI